MREEPETEQLTGTLHIDVGLNIHVKEVQNTLKSVFQTEEFKVTVFRSDSTVVLSFDRAADIPENIELETGDYYVEAHSDNDLPAAFENPYYFGSSGPFTVQPNELQSVVIICELANTMVSVSYSQNITGSFLDYTTTVSSGLGFLVFPPDETRKGYFRPLPLDILVDLSYQKPDGTLVTSSLSGSIPDPLANTHYQIQVDAAILEGMASFQVLLDTSGVVVEVVRILGDTSGLPPGIINYGDLLITEIMYNPTALSDTDGEWFELYNPSGKAINLQNLVIGRDDANRHTITDSIVLEPGDYMVMARTDTAVVLPGYVYGSDLTLPNSGAILTIYNEGPESDPGIPIFSLDYGSSGFPDGSGASISLDPGNLNPADAESGSSWCTSSTIFSTGDLGTPGLPNDPCQ